VGVELDEGDRAVPLRHSPQLGEKHGMVAAEGDRDDARFVHGGERRGDAVHGAVREPWHDGRVAEIDRREAVEDGDALGRVVRRTQRQRPLTHGLGPEARPSAEGRPRVERQADEGDVDVVEMGRVGQAEEGGDTGEARRLLRIGRTMSLHGHLLYCAQYRIVAHGAADTDR